MKARLALFIALTAASLLPATIEAHAQSGDADQFTEKGRITISGLSTRYLIRRLPINSFPDLPAAIQNALNQRGCLVPQTYEAHGPENVVHASFERPGSSDWAVLCSAKGTVSLLVFFSDKADAFVLASAPETAHLQPHGGESALGFNWGIDSATPEQVHQAQSGLQPRPVLLDHDALADSAIDHQTIYHFYDKGAWKLVEMPVP